MGQRSVYDPRDPWAFRNTWTGEIRNSYDDLWIWLTLIIGITLVALLLLIPLLMHRYCRSELFCPNWCSCFDRTLSVVKEIENERIAKNRERRQRKREYDRQFGRPTAINYDAKRELKNGSKSYHHYPDPCYTMNHNNWTREPYTKHNLPIHPEYPYRSHSLPRHSNARGPRYERRSSSVGRRAKHRHHIPRITLN